MNLFYLSRNPVDCARQHCDKHAIKMPTEYAQMLSTAHRVCDGFLVEEKTFGGRRIKRWRHPIPHMEAGLMLSSHVGNAINRWVRLSKENYLYLFELYVALSFEYEYRYGRDHQSYLKYAHLLELPPMAIGEEGWSEPCQAMPDKYKVVGDAIAGYRNFYIHDKSRFATWRGKVHCRPAPAWFTSV